MAEDQATEPLNARGLTVFLFTTFPVLSETFLEREVTVLKESGLAFELVSLWGGEPEWKGLPVTRFGLAGIVRGLLHLPIWVVKNPSSVCGLISMLWRPRSSGTLNWGENLLGCLYALASAGKLKEAGVTHLHGVWASAPCMAALGVHRLVGIPFTCAAHAYDLFENGGDGWIREKLAESEWVRTSTHAGARRLRELGASPDRIRVVRRGLARMPELKEFARIECPVRILSVGRMVEKMGFERQIPLFEALRTAGIEFEVTWIGGGPLLPTLEKAVHDAGLAETVHFSGARPYAEVEEAYAQHDLFFFTGQIDSRGDRAGLPNAIAEAMAWGLPVFATSVGAVEEAIIDGETGFLWQGNPSIDAVLEILETPSLQEQVRVAARAWIEENFNAAKNLGPLIARWRG